MRYSIVLLAAAVSALSIRDDCQATYNSCIAAGTPEVVCQCSLATCSGEDAARIRSFCATATANLRAATSSSASIVTGTIVQPSGAPQITAAAGSLNLGDDCGADEQCKDGVQCFGSTAGTIRRCGNFNAECTADDQCAYNTCNNGLCNGFLASTAYLANGSPSTTRSGSNATSAPVQSLSHGGNGTSMTRGPAATGNGIRPTSSIIPSTGDAGMIGVFCGAAALIAGAAAWAL